MPNSRISDLTEQTQLVSDGVNAGSDDDALVLLARAKSHNETIKYSNFKKSVNDASVLITGVQDIAGEKTFEDNAFFKKDVTIDGHLTVQGDVFNLRFEDSDGNALDSYSTNLDSDLVISGKANLGDDLTVANDADIHGSLKVSGVAEFADDLNVAGNLTVTQSGIKIDNEVDVTGNLKVNGQTEVTTLAVEQNTEIGGSLGIGVSGPEFGLHVQGDGDILVEDITGGSAHLRMRSKDPSDQSLLSYWKIKSAPEGSFEIDNDSPQRTAPTNNALCIDGITSNVGIGTLAPSKKLDVSGDVNFSGDLYQNNIPFNTGKWDDATTSSDIHYSKGKVGIGTDTPISPFHVTVDSKFTGDIISEGKLLFKNVYPMLTDLPSPTEYHGMFAHVHDTGKAYFSHAGTWLAFVNEQSDGKVGIGTSFPDEQLHVEGNIKLTGDLVGLENFVASGAITADGLNILNDGLITLNGADSKLVAPNIDAGDIDADQITVTGSDLIVNGIDSKVGIGLNNPEEPLEISDADSTAIKMEMVTAGEDVKGLIFKSLGDGTINERIVNIRMEVPASSEEDPKLKFIYQNSDNATTGVPAPSSANTPLTLYGSKVGIGTDDPSAELHVAGKIQSDDNISAGTVPAVERLVLSDDKDVKILLHAETKQSSIFGNTEGSLGFNAGANGGVTNTNIGFNINSAEIMRLTQDGKMGLGVSNPSSLLHVKKSGAGSDLMLKLENVDANASGAESWFINHLDGTDSNSGGLTIGHVNGNTTSKDLNITPGGSIGVGTDSPTKTLDVSGDINFSGKIYKNGVEFSGGPIGAGDSFNGAPVSSPNSSNAAGVKGDFLFDDEYAYICVVDSDGNDANKKAWKRFPISDW